MAGFSNSIKILTDSQLKILAHCANGETFSQIAETEHISWHTVKNQVYKAKLKTGAASIPQCIMLAIARGELKIDFRGIVSTAA
jgi:DNA-binding CsgD family transcriptional regulator